MLHNGVEEKIPYQIVRDFDRMDDEDPTCPFYLFLLFGASIYIDAFHIVLLGCLNFFPI